MTKTALRILVAACLTAGTVQASLHSFKFDGPTDPTDPVTGNLSVFRAGDTAELSALAGVWVPTNGSTLEGGVANQSTNGYLAITQTTPLLSAHGMRSGIIFDDFDAGLVVAGFTFSCDVRIGAGSDSPADGFSLNFVRADDPVILNNNGSGFACHPAGCGTESNLPEEGTTTGLSICFDAWDSGAPDVIGLTIRVDNTIITNIAMPTLNGACTNPASLQTGPNSGGVAGLCWQPLFVQLTSGGLLNVSYKGNAFLTNFVVNFAPSAGRLVFAGRTGGAWQEQDVDNITIDTIPSATPVVAQPFVANANGFRLLITDSGIATVNTNSLTLKLDGSSVTPSSIAQNGAITTVGYQNTALLLAAGSSHTGIVHFTGSGFAGSVDVTNIFTIPAYKILTSTQKAPGAVNTGLSGFAGRIHQMPVPRYPDEGSLIAIERQLADGFIDPNTGLPYANNAGVSTFTDEVINWNQAKPNGNDIGIFRADAVPPADWPDEAIPGTDSTASDPDHIAVEFLTILDLPVGSYQLGVNHDDGFKLTAGAEPRDVFNATLLSTDRGALDTPNISFVVTNAGRYPVRLVWGENGGGAQVEFYLVDFLTGTKILINNRTNSAQITSYRDTAALTQPFVRWVFPAAGETGIAADSSVLAKLEDGTAGTITDNSISLKVNGLGTATHTRTGGEVVATLASPAVLGSGSTNTATLIYNTSAGGPFTNTWQFVAAPYTTIPTGLRTPPGSGSNPGFRVHAFQTPNTNIFNGFPNNTRIANEAINGQYGANIANLTSFTNSDPYGLTGLYLETNIVNYAEHGDGSVYTTGNFPGDVAIPGVPGANNIADNCVLEFITFLEFPAAGFYSMGVNSDDGFRVTLGDRSSPGKGMLQVMAPAAIAGEYVAMSTTQTDRDGNRGFGGPLPTTPIIAQAVICDPVFADVPLKNAAAIAGKIAVCQRGPSFATQSRNCFDAGAIAVVGGLAPGDAGQLPGTRGGSDAGITIPCLQVTYELGTNLIARGTTNGSSPLVLRVSADDCSLNLGEYSGGRGSSDTTFGLYVPQAGLYPMRLVWENGGGDANVEWFTINSNGTHLAINDATAGAIKAWRARVVSTGSAQVIKPTLSNGNVILSWTGEGELEEALAINGPWNKSAFQNNPATIPAYPLSPVRFFRIRQY
jgi:hypothetical protein